MLKKLQISDKSAIRMMSTLVVQFFQVYLYQIFQFFAQENIHVEILMLLWPANHSTVTSTGETEYLGKEILPFAGHLEYFIHFRYLLSIGNSA